MTVVYLVEPRRRTLDERSGIVTVHEGLKKALEDILETGPCIVAHDHLSKISESGIVISHFERLGISGDLTAADKALDEIATIKAQLNVRHFTIVHSDPTLADPEATALRSRIDLLQVEFVLPED